MSARARYVAFLRAINVGGRNVKMDRLRAEFASLGFDEVETFIASGNVVFRAEQGSSAALETRIEEHLLDRLGWEVTTFLRTPAELGDVASQHPFGEIEPGHTLAVAFLQSAPGTGADERVRDQRTDYDDLRLHGREIYWHCRGGLSGSLIRGGSVEKALGWPTTVRNMNTVRKLAAKYAPEGS